MAIRVVCPNGHELWVKAEFAGKTGLCPKCRAKVKVPAPSLEDTVLDVLAGPASDEASGQGSSLKFSRSDPKLTRPPKKPCARCQREIEMNTHICPHCHTYIASLSDLHLR